MLPVPNRVLWHTIEAGHFRFVDIEEAGNAQLYIFGFLPFVFVFVFRNPYFRRRGWVWVSRREERSMIDAAMGPGSF
jgi:hypothetical protein